MARIPFRRRRETKTTAEAPSAAEPPKEGAGAPSSPTRAAQDPGAAAPRTKPAPGQPPDPHERIDGLRAWVAQVDRKLGVRTYVLGAIGLLALAAAAVALVLVVQLKRDAATKDDIDAIQGQLSGIQQSATQAAQQGVRSLNRRLTDLEQELGRLSTQQSTSKRELQVVRDDIKELRSQVSSGAGGAGSGGTGGTGSSGGAGAGTGGTP